MGGIKYNFGTQRHRGTESQRMTMFKSFGFPKNTAPLNLLKGHELLN
ncbi:MAG: hypothetical protein JWM28_1255 [Chitinophagaceae bacterium]|nr:hypothetical protein [Chitinophagaceae bacterium]